MVTTRSADKRVDTTREEDLVLRSRTVASPSSNASTPSQPRKRAAGSRVQINLPQKRARITYDGTNDEDDAAAVRSHNSSSSETRDRDELLAASTPRPTVRTFLSTPKPGGLIARTNLEDDASPMPENFQTPATSKHRRFGSEEIDDETIILDQGPNSVVHKGYETAQEEISDSDGPPEVEILDTSLTKKAHRGTRAPRTKKTDSEVISTETTEGRTEALLSEQAEAGTLVEVPAIETLDAIKPVVNESEPSQNGANEAVQGGIMLSTSAPVLASVSETKHDDDNNGAAAVNIQLISAEPELQIEAAPIVPAQALNQHIRLDPGGSDIAITRASESISLLSGSDYSPSYNSLKQSTSRKQKQASSSGISDTKRLPDRARNSLETFRRNKMNHGSLRLERQWAKKRSTFVS